MKVWTLQNTNMKARRGIYGKNRCTNKLLTVTSNAEDYLAGGSDGTVQVFKGNTLHIVKKNHTRSVECIIA